MQHDDADLARLQDVRAAAARIATFIGQMNRDQFLLDEKTQSAVIHQILIIGEAVKNLTEEATDAHPEVPWRLIARTRDMIIHHYQRIDITEVWNIATRDIPPLHVILNRILPTNL